MKAESRGLGIVKFKSRFLYICTAFKICHIIPSVEGIKVKVRGKVVPVLLLTKHHTMKASCGSGGIAPRILELGTRWR
jgi:hypothetical protein